MALQQLIQNFVAKKGKIRSDEAAFEPCAAGNASGRDQERKPSGLDDGGDDSTRWGRSIPVLARRVALAVFRQPD